MIQGGSNEAKGQECKGYAEKCIQAVSPANGAWLIASYAEFVTISKEISTLENDMIELKELLGQWKDLPQLMGMEDTLAPRLDKEGNRESPEGRSC